MEFKNINSLFRWRVERSGSNVAILQKTHGKWVKVSWNRYYESVRFIAQGLRSLGINKGDRVVIFCNTRIEWFFSDMGILGCGGVTVPIYHSSPTSEIEYIVNHCDAKIIIVENPELLDKVLKVRENLENLEKIILIDGPPPYEDDEVMLISELVELGRTEKEHKYETMADEVELNDIATIVYTSTSGPQKGVVHEHSQLLAEQYAVSQVMPTNENELALLFLPLSHIFGRVIEYWNLYSGIKLAIAESYDRLSRNMREVDPHYLAAVPRVLQKIFSISRQEVDNQGKLKRTMMDWCLEVGSKVALYKREKRPIPMKLNFEYQAANKMFFERFRMQFGTNLTKVVCSGAPLPKEIGNFFEATGITVLEAYGLTETGGAATMNSPVDYKIGSVGKPIPGCEVKLESDGEIIIRGQNIMREYWKDPEGTKELLKDGWFYTGDIGEIDEDGFLKITDRKKSLIITSGGKNIAPMNIEKHICSDPYIDQVCVHGDKRNFLTALITLNRDSVEYWAKEKNINFKTYEELIKKEEVRRLIEERVHIKNQDLAGPETIKKFSILADSFTVEGGEITSTMKLNRKFIESKYKDILDSFYN